MVANRHEGDAAVELLSVETSLPGHVVTCNDTRSHLPVLTGGDARAARFQQTIDHTHVDRRHSVLALADLVRLHGVPERARAYEEHALGLAERVARSALQAALIDPAGIGTVIALSCTGYMLPSLDAYLTPKLGIGASARRIPITELGCSAGVAAIGLGSDLASNQHARPVLVTSVELCSLCIQTHEPSDTDAIGNILFGDAAAAVVLARRDANGPRGPQVVASRSFLWPESTHLLGMRHTDTGFRLVLSPELPAAVDRNLRPTIRAILDPLGMHFKDMTFWVVHPGGPKILETVGESLGLSDSVLRPSWDVLRQCGNISSASVFFILRALQASAPPADGDIGMMVAFGPGLSCEVVVLRAHGWLTRRP